MVYYQYSIRPGNMVCRQGDIQRQSIHLYWGKTETRQAEVTNFRVNSFIRFRWLDDEDPKAYFELKMVYNELTSDYMLEVIDWAAPDEVEDTKELWDSEIEKLKRVSGL